MVVWGCDWHGPGMGLVLQASYDIAISASVIVLLYQFETKVIR